MENAWVNRYHILSISRLPDSVTLMDIPRHLQTLVTQLDALSQDDLQVLNRYIVAQFKQKNESRRASVMAGFTPGDLVSFEDKQGQRLSATVIRTNKKTVSLVTLDDVRWNVAPELLTLESSPARIGTRTEWTGGLIQAPGMVTGEPGGAYTPSMWVWLNESSLVMGMDILDPKEGPHNTVESLQRTIKNPMVDNCRGPSHVRVNDQGVAQRLSRAFPSIAISCSITPELDAFQQTMEAGIQAKQAPLTYSDIDADDKTLSYFFNACATLFRAKPWSRIEHCHWLIGVSIEELDIHDAVIMVMGQSGKELGISVFDSIAEYTQSMLVTDALEYNVSHCFPAGKLLNFESVKDINPQTVDDIKQHGWTIANTRAYPMLLTFDENLSPRPGTEEDLLLLGSICNALPHAIDSVHFMRALQGKGEHTVELPAGPLNKGLRIKLQAPFPYEKAFKNAGAADSLMARLLLLDHTWDEDNPAWDKHQILTEQLEKNYRQSLEAQAEDEGPGLSTLIMMLAFSEKSRTIATLTIADLEDIVFNIVPQRAMVHPNHAESMIHDARAFFNYLKRVYAFASADAFIALLDHTAPGRLAMALTDTSSFSMGKSALAAGEFAPSFDAFDAFSDQPFAASTATKPKPMDKKSRKKKRSASRKARKKNR